MIIYNAYGKPYLPIKKIMDEEYPQIEYRPVNIFVGVDPASSTNTTADYSVIFPVAVDIDLDIFCLPYFRRRVTPMVLAEEILGTFKRLRPENVRIETTGYQEMLADYLRKHPEKIYIPGLEVPNKPRDKKSKRLESMEHLFRRGKVHLLEESMQEFIDEMLLYPKGKNDDILDAFYYAVKNIYPPSHTIEDLKVKMTEYSVLKSMLKRRNWKLL